MIRAALFGLMLVLILSSACCLAQQAADAGGQAPAEAQLPDFASRAVSGESAVDMADFVDGYLDTTGAVPELVQVQTSDRTLQSISAAEAFVLLARTTYLWRMTGNLPETVPIAPDEVSAPVLDPEDIVPPPDNPELGREIPTENFLAQCSAVVQWVDRLQVIPTAVWVDGQRLSAAEYLAGLAICVSYAYWEGQLYEYIFLPLYAAPQSWTGEEAGYYQAEAEQSAAEYQPEEYQAEAEPEQEYVEEYQEEGYAEYADQEQQYQAEETWGESGEEGMGESLGEAPAQQWGEEEEWAPEPSEYPEAEEYAPEPSEYSEPEEEAYQGTPDLTVLPEPGSEVSGIVDLVASYTGPPARFVIFRLDRKDEVMMNSPPYSYRWDTSRLEGGPHTVRVQVLGDEDRLLADQTSAYTVVPPAAEKKAPGK